MATKSLISHIMVLVDGTERGTRAAALAVTLAKCTGTRLTALAVVDVETLRQLHTHRVLAAKEMIEMEAALETNARRHLEQVRGTAQQEQVGVEQVLLRGSWYNSALAEGRTRGIDLLVLPGFSTHVGTRDLLAREYQRILDEAPYPVLIVK